MNKKITILTCLAAFSLLVIGITSLIVQSQIQNVNQQNEDVPIVDYYETLPTNPNEKIKRERKNKLRNVKLNNPNESRRFMITEKRESSYGGFDSDTPPEPAIPAAQSDLVIIGEVNGGRAYLSEDKVTIYSEFNIVISEVLKNSSPNRINKGESLTVFRGGGGVRFPSGKVIKKLFEGKPMPRNRRIYLFFLKFDSVIEDYQIITAYEFFNDQIIPIDGLKRDGRGIVEQLASHQSYRGMLIKDFIPLVQRANTNSQDIFERRQQ